MQVCAAESIPDSMLYKAAVALSQMTSEAEMAKGSVFPSLVHIRKCSQTVRHNPGIATGNDATIRAWPPPKIHLSPRACTPLEDGPSGSEQALL
eukprot:scaffold26724_cov120-Isochrysis_galbana.AAC.13